MTLSLLTASKQYTGDGVTVAFPTVFAFNTSADIEVIETTIATGVQVTKTLTTDYTVSGGSTGVPVDGTVTAVAAPANTVTWTINRIVPNTQDEDIPTAGAFNSAQVEKGLDRVVMQVQQNTALFNRAVKAPVGDDLSVLDLMMPAAVDRASKLFSFDVNGNPTVRALSDGGTGTLSNVSEDSTPTLGGDLALGGFAIDFPTTPNITDVLDQDDLSGDSATKLATQQSIKAYVDAQVAVVVTPRGYMAGLVLSRDAGDTEHDINVAVGVAQDTANSISLVLGTTITKQINATWANGDDAGGLNDTDHPVENSTWYHVHLLGNTAGTNIDVGFDKDPSAGSLLSDVNAVADGLTKYRRIGSILTDGSGNIIDFKQVGDYFQWQAPVLDVNSSSIGTTASSNALTVAPDKQVVAHFNISARLNSSVGTMLVSSLDVNDLTAADGTGVGNLTFNRDTMAATGSRASTNMQMITDTNRQIRLRAAATFTLVQISTVGWTDRRGRDD
jgi:hypothetical protein